MEPHSTVAVLRSASFHYVFKARSCCRLVTVFSRLPHAIECLHSLFSYDRAISHHRNTPYIVYLLLSWWIWVVSIFWLLWKRLLWSKYFLEVLYSILLKIFGSKIVSLCSPGVPWMYGPILSPCTLNTSKLAGTFDPPASASQGLDDITSSLPLNPSTAFWQQLANVLGLFCSPFFHPAIWGVMWCGCGLQYPPQIMQDHTWGIVSCEAGQSLHSENYVVPSVPWSTYIQISCIRRKQTFVLLGFFVCLVCFVVFCGLTII